MLDRITIFKSESGAVRFDFASADSGAIIASGSIPESEWHELKTQLTTKLSESESHCSAIDYMVVMTVLLENS